MTNRVHFGLFRFLMVLAYVLVRSSPAWAKGCTMCGSNAATVHDGVVFDELNVNGLNHAGGPKITQAKLSSGHVAQLRVVGDQLFTHDKVTGADAPAAAGLVISLAMEDGREYQLLLQRLGDYDITPSGSPDLDFWAEPPGKTPSYHFTVAKIKNRSIASISRTRRTDGKVAPVRVCPCAPSKLDDRQCDDERPANPTLFEHICTGPYVEESNIQTVAEEHLAVVFTGDQYNPDHRVVTEDPGWFNLACSGTASFKMHMLRHTTASSGPLKKPTTFDQRTAMLRAITADYCNDGRSWTGDGTPLFWTDRGQLFPFTDQPGGSAADFSDPETLKKQVEAVWGPTGELLCLNEPRRTPIPETLPPNTKLSQTPNLSTPPTCTAPAVIRGTISTAGMCPALRSIPRCDALRWSPPVPHLPLPPKSSTLGIDFLLAHTLPSAYVITVNKTPNSLYCNPEPPGVISWP